MDLAVGDLYNNGLNDVVVISNVTNDVCIYNRTEDGALSSLPWRISMPGITDMKSIAIGDLYNNGLEDIVVSLWGTGRRRYIAIINASTVAPFFGPSNVWIRDVDLNNNHAKCPRTF